MLKMRLALIFALFLVICLSYQTVQAADAAAAKAEPEPASEPEPTAEPTGDDEVSQRADKSVAKNDKSGKNTGIQGSTTLAIPTLLVFAAVAKWIL